VDTDDVSLDQGETFTVGAARSSTDTLLRNTGELLARGQFPDNEARRRFEKFEEWFAKQQFKDWRRKANWQLLHQEARAVVNTMPRVALGD
jgi:hypothetical protein